MCLPAPDIGRYHADQRPQEGPECLHLVILRKRSAHCETKEKRDGTAGPYAGSRRPVGGDAGAGTRPSPLPSSRAASGRSSALAATVTPGLQDLRRPGVATASTGATATAPPTAYWPRSPSTSTTSPPREPLRAVPTERSTPCQA